MRPKEATSDSVIRPFLACQSLVITNKHAFGWYSLAESWYLGLALDLPKKISEDASFMSSNYWMLQFHTSICTNDRAKGVYIIRYHMLNNLTMNFF